MNEFFFHQNNEITDNSKFQRTDSQNNQLAIQWQHEFEKHLHDGGKIGHHMRDLELADNPDGVQHNDRSFSLFQVFENSSAEEIEKNSDTEQRTVD